MKTENLIVKGKSKFTFEFKLDAKSGNIAFIYYLEGEREMVRTNWIFTSLIVADNDDISDRKLLIKDMIRLTLRAFPLAGERVIEKAQKHFTA